MTDIKISADLTEAIEKVSEKLGIATDAIIPEYTKRNMINGVTWIFGGLLLAVLPWLILPESKILPDDNFGSYDFRWDYLYYAARWIFCGITTWIGLYTCFVWIENIATPKALAISTLLNQIRR